LLSQQFAQPPHAEPAQEGADPHIDGGHFKPSVKEPREQPVRHACHAVSDHIDDLGVEHVATQQKLIDLQRKVTAVDDEEISRSHVSQLDTRVFELFDSAAGQ
jgi:hypothetical protein